MPRTNIIWFPRSRALFAFIANCCVRDSALFFSRRQQSTSFGGGAGVLAPGPSSIASSIVPPSLAPALFRAPAEPSAGGQGRGGPAGAACIARRVRGVAAKPAISGARLRPEKNRKIFETQLKTCAAIFLQCQEN